MIIEIKRPNIKFKFDILSNYKYYYNEETNEFFIQNNFNTKKYFNLEGNIHRIGKPAIEYTNGVKIWVENGKENRLDGPSYHGKYQFQYYIDDICYSKKDFAEKNKSFNLQIL